MAKTADTGFMELLRKKHGFACGKTAGFTDGTGKTSGYATCTGKTSGYATCTGKTFGFTLAELLIALVILGLIATFTIPKVLSSQQSSQWKASAKEAASMISGAHQALQQAGTLSVNTRAGNLTQVMNYLAYDTTSSIDNIWGGTDDCASKPCIRLHNGGILSHWDHNFCGTGEVNAIGFGFDPDGQPGGATAIEFFISYTGKLTTRANVDPATTWGWGAACTETVGARPADPAWFNWT